MPSSNPLPPKENALFKRILVRIPACFNLALLCTFPQVNVCILSFEGVFYDTGWPKYYLLLYNRPENILTYLMQTLPWLMYFTFQCLFIIILFYAYYKFCLAYDYFYFLEVLRTEAIQKWAEVRKANSVKSQIPGTWRLVFRILRSV